MKAFAIHRYGGPQRLALRDLPEPEPGPGDLLIAMRAASVNPVDFKIRSGALKMLVKDRFPLVLGSDVSGVVERVGPGVSRFAPGSGQPFRLRLQTALREVRSREIII
jgi:NADPH:quinone reductase-like Zn-dependent oxidoreductase